MSKEWDATSYHKVSGPQTGWGQKVLARLPLRGDEQVIDAGCGSGRLTAELAARLPGGTVTAIDRSWNMLQTARANLRPTFGTRVRFVQVSLPDVPFREAADVVFSTATFHWVLDHDALFANLFAALRPGGRLHAQCGGGANLARARALADDLLSREPYAAHFRDWPAVWQYANDVDTRRRLERAGFVDVEADLEEAPTAFATEADYREFVSTVIFHPHLARLPEALRGRFVDDITRSAAAEPTPFLLDYWRLNLQATRPSGRA